MLEEDIAVFSGAAERGMIRIERMRTERGKGVLVDHGGEILVVPNLDFLNFMRGAEAVEEIEERHSALDGGKMGDRAEIHDFLRIGFREHRKAGLTACINVGMIAEDVQRVGSDAACGYVDDTGKQLACDFVHVRDHEQKSLRCRVGRREGACRERAVYGACRACLGLHLHDFDTFPENVLESGCRPRVRHFSHRAGRGDGVDGGNFRERIRYMRRGGIAVHGNLFSCHVFLSSDTISLHI